MTDENRKTPFCNIQHPDHACIQELPINDIKNSIHEIQASIKRVEGYSEAMKDATEISLKVLTDQQSKTLEIMFGMDLQGGVITSLKLLNQSLSRVWWIVGIIVTAFLATGVKVWLF